MSQTQNNNVFGGKMFFETVTFADGLLTSDLQAALAWTTPCQACNTQLAVGRLLSVLGGGFVRTIWQGAQRA